MALAMSISYIKGDGPMIRVGFNLTPSGNYVVGGDIIDFTTATQDPAFVGDVAAVEALGAPISLDVWDAGGGIATGLFPVIGTTIKNCKVKAVTAYNTEAGVVSWASLATVKMQGEAMFNKL